jgi:uncharacterized membrane protein
MTTLDNNTGTSVVFKPGVFSSYGHGWKMLWPHFLVLFLIGIIFFAISSVFSVPQWIFTRGETVDEFTGVAFLLGLLGFVYSLLVVNPVNYGQTYAYLRAVRGDKVEVENMFAAFKNYWNAVAASLVVGIIVVIGFILLIVPGIIFACKLAFVPYLVVDKKMTLGKAIDTSWHMTNGHAGKVFLIALLGIPIGIAGFICLGVGIIIAIMWISMASASLYYAVSKEKEATIIQAPAVPPSTVQGHDIQPQGPVIS